MSLPVAGVRPRTLAFIVAVVAAASIVGVLLAQPLTASAVCTSPGQSSGCGPGAGYTNTTNWDCGQPLSYQNDCYASGVLSFGNAPQRSYGWIQAQSQTSEPGLAVCVNDRTPSNNGVYWGGCHNGQSQVCAKSGCGDVATISVADVFHQGSGQHYTFGSAKW